MLIHKRDSRAMAAGGHLQRRAPKMLLTKIISEENEDEEALRIVVVVVVRSIRQSAIGTTGLPAVFRTELSLPALPFLVLS